MFYIKAALSGIWFAITATSVLIFSLARWRHPSNGYIFTYLFTRGTSKILGVKIKIINPENLRKNRPCVYVGNHQSNLDIINQAYCYQPRTLAVGKKEVIWIPFFGLLFYATGNILLDRKNHKKAVQSLQIAKDFLMNRNISFWMFPEGHRNQGSQQLLPFKKGAFHMAIDAQVPIVPIVSSPIDRLIDLKARRITPGTVFNEVLEPIPTKGLTEKDVESLLELTYSRMQEAFARLRETHP